MKKLLNLAVCAMLAGSMTVSSFAAPLGTYMKGSQGDEVKEIQEMLIATGYLEEGQADGIFGTKTVDAVKEFQKDHKLREDGMVGEETYNLLKEAEEEPVVAMVADAPPAAGETADDEKSADEEATEDAAADEATGEDEKAEDAAADDAAAEDEKAAEAADEEEPVAEPVAEVVTPADTAAATEEAEAEDEKEAAEETDAAATDEADTEEADAAAADEADTEEADAEAAGEADAAATKEANVEETDAEAAEEADTEEADAAAAKEADAEEADAAAAEEADAEEADATAAEEGTEEADAAEAEEAEAAAEEEPAADLGLEEGLLEEVDYELSFPSWNQDSEALTELVDFVLACADESSPEYLEPEDRIATFDMDGTILCEKAPVYFDYCLTMYRVLDDPDYEATEEEIDAMQQIRDVAYSEGSTFKPETITKDDLVASAFAGMTPEEFREYVADFADSVDVVGFDGMTYGESFYKPMIEVIDFLRAYDFDVWIVSACEREVVRGLVDRYDIPYDHCIATDVPYVASNLGDEVADEYNMGQDETILLGAPLNEVECGKSGKPAAIAREIGKRPVLAFGNSSGDYSMLNYAEGNPDHTGMGFFIVCDDT
ncbi:MAG: peptidoglycan-binding protein, partial [Blautia sp.]|nr:peptidoglycan-binding protein [Blautia sp.]